MISIVKNILSIYNFFVYLCIGSSEIQGTSSHHFHPPLDPQGIGHRSRHHRLRRVDLRCRTKDEAEVHTEQGAVLSLPQEKWWGKYGENDGKCRFKMFWVQFLEKKNITNYKIIADLVKLKKNSDINVMTYDHRQGICMWCDWKNLYIG